MRLHLTAIERYVMTQTLANVAGAGAVISAVVLLIDFVSLSRDIASRVDVSFLQMVTLTLTKAPSVIVVLLPFMFLFGTLAAFVSLNRRSELVAMRAAGLSAWRFILPAAGAAFVFGLITITMLNPLTAMLTDRFERQSSRLIEGRAGEVTQDIWRPQGDGRTRVMIHAKGRDRVGGQIRLKNVTMFQYTITRDGGMEFVRRYEAAEALLKTDGAGEGFWELRQVQEVTPGSGAFRHDSVSLPTTIDPSEEIERFASPDAISFWKLPDAIRTTEQAGFSAAGYRLRLYQLMAAPVLFSAMSILAAAFSLRLMRLGGLGVLAASGVALGFVFFFLNELSGALGKADLAPVFAAAWAPPIIALLSGLTLLIYTEDG